jgi:hypothetical protein
MREMKGLTAGASAQKRANAVIPSSLDATAINSSSEIQDGAATLNRPSPSPCKVPGTSGLNTNLVLPDRRGAPCCEQQQRRMTALTGLKRHSSVPYPPWTLVLFWKLSATPLAPPSLFSAQQAPLRPTRVANLEGVVDVMAANRHHQTSRLKVSGGQDSLRSTS